MLDDNNEYQIKIIIISELKKMQYFPFPCSSIEWICRAKKTTRKLLKISCSWNIKHHAEWVLNIDRVRNTFALDLCLTSFRKLRRAGFVWNQTGTTALVCPLHVISSDHTKRRAPCTFQLICHGLGYTTLKPSGVENICLLFCLPFVWSTWFINNVQYGPLVFNVQSIYGYVIDMMISSLSK